MRVIFFHIKLGNKNNLVKYRSPLNLEPKYRPYIPILHTILFKMILCNLLSLFKYGRTMHVSTTHYYDLWPQQLDSGYLRKPVPQV